MTHPFSTSISLLFYAAGIVSAVFALWRSRTTQGATAWIIGLLGFPYLMVPLFLIFGRDKFLGYVKQRRELDQAARKEMQEIHNLDDDQTVAPPDLESLTQLARLAKQPGFTDGNHVKLLINAEATFEDMLARIAEAQNYILFQFYVIRPDHIGQKFADALIAKAKQGVEVRILYDAIGTRLHKKFLKKLTDGGVEVCRFNSTKPWSFNIQINFRNHRKLVIIDGRTAYVGGINVGDDYLGLHPKIGPWRDTHCRIDGPSAVVAQLSFVKDWYWAKSKILDLQWDVPASGGGSKCLILHTGPADEADTALLAHITLVQSAKKKIWIANPYFLPPEGLSKALELAALRGVEVKVLTPLKSDQKFVKYASETYVESLLKIPGISFFRYRPAFLHQKVLLVDDEIAVVGSTNLDPRSLFVNFEIQAISDDPKFVSSVTSMLENDFAASEAWSAEELHHRSLPRKILSRASTLISPVL